MREGKAITLLKTASPEDLRQIKKMLDSSFFTTNEHLGSLFKLLRSYYPDFQSKKLDKELVFQRLFPRHPYSDIKLRNLLRDFTRILEEYFILKAMRNDEFQKRKLLAKIYLERGNTEWFGKEMNRLQKSLEASPYRDGEYYREAYELNSIQLEAMPTNQLKARAQLLAETASLLDAANRFATIKIESEQESFSEIGSVHSASLQEDPLKENIAFHIYQQLIKLYQTENLGVFQQLIQLFSQNINLVRPHLRLELLTHLINYAIRSMKNDDLFYNQIALELYQLGLSHQILIQNNHLSSTAYLNIITIGAKAKAFEWTTQFAKDYEKYLPEATKQEVETLGRAHLNFHQQRFSRAIDEIAQQHFVHPFYRIGARLHSLRCYYELFLLNDSYFSFLTDQCLALEKSVYRNQFISKSYAKAILNFSKFIRKLANKRLLKKLTTREINYFSDQLKNQNITISRSWLLEKIKE